MDLKKQSPAAGQSVPDELKPYYLDGSVALQYVDAYDARSLLAVFSSYGDQPIAFPGYPAAEGNGTVMETDDVFVIPSSAHDPDAAWAFIRDFLMGDGLNDISRWSVTPGMSAYLPLLEREFADIRARTKVVSESGGIIMTCAPTFTEEEIEAMIDQFYGGVAHTLQPGCTEEAMERAMDLVDKSGRSFRNELPDGLDDIVSEEISGFIAGLGTPEDCAAKIQSRAAIWFAENQ